MITTDAQEKIVIPMEVDDLLEEFDDDLPRRPAPFYSAKWFLSFFNIFIIAISLIVLVTTASGAWKYGFSGGKGSDSLPHTSGFGKWDSFDYSDFQSLHAESKGAPDEQVEAEGDTSPPIGSEALLSAAHENEIENHENALIGMHMLGEPELKGKCDFERFEPTGKEGGIRIISGTMGDYGSLYKLLKESGLSANEGAELTKAMGKFLEVTKVRAEDSIRMYLKQEDNSFWFLVYQRSDTTIYHFLKSSESGIDAHKVNFPTQKKWTKAGGEVHGSLFKSVEKAGLDSSIVNHFIEVFGAYINFSEQTREGDTFKVIVSSEWVGKKFMAYDPPQALSYSGVKTGNITAIYYPPDSDNGSYYKPDGMKLKKVLCDVPVTSPRISSPFNPRRMHPILKTIKPHWGTDFAAPTGTPIYAWADGTVKVAKMAGAMGYMVHIEHTGNVETYYGHMHGFAKGIKAAVKVKKGQLIGYIGNTGRSTGPHLHFGMKRGGSWVDPMKYLKVRTTKETPVASSMKEAFFKRAKTMLGLLGQVSIKRAGKEAQQAAKESPKKPAAAAEEKQKKPPAAAAEGKKEGGRWDTEWQ